MKLTEHEMNLIELIKQPCQKSIILIFTNLCETSQYLALYLLLILRQSIQEWTK